MRHSLVSLTARSLSIHWDTTSKILTHDNILGLDRPLSDRNASSAKEAFDRYLANGRPAFIDRELPEPAEAVRWIRDAGGVAVLAHPTWVRVVA